MASRGNRGILYIYFYKYQDLMIFFILLMLFQPLPAEAHENANVDSGNVCLKATVQAEEKYQIKTNLLTSISNVETGRWNEQASKKVAWPWTVNVNGKGHFYKTKAEAVAAVKDWQRRGYRSIDVGCMQINLRFHGRKFASIEDAFDPDKNVEIAAQILKERYSVRKDWMQAAADYHSKNHRKAQVYMKKLLVALNNVKTEKSQAATQYVPKIQYASNLLITKDNRNWLSKLVGQKKKNKELEISLKD